jgi:hypothetical protein
MRGDRLKLLLKEASQCTAGTNQFARRSSTMAPPAAGLVWIRTR